MNLKLKHLVFALYLVSVACQPSHKNNPLHKTSDQMVFDSLKAQALGADEYGMKSYVLAFLYEGPNRDQDSIEAVAIQQAHLENIKRMAQEGVLVLAGPFLEEGELKGIYIFNTSDQKQVEEYCLSDPAIEAGRLRVELKPWYGSAALQELNRIHQSLAQKSI